jgi:hypothetical protein
MSARIDDDGTVTPLDGKATPDEVVTEDDVQKPPVLSRLIARVLRDVALLNRRWAPQRLVYPDRVSTGSTGAPQTFRFEHRLAGRVLWWVADWKSTATVAPAVRKTTATTEDTLVLQVMTAGTFTLVIEEAG